MPDAASDGCVLGTVEHCGACDDRCPGPQDHESTVRVCIDGACDIQCEEEYYDVDGALDNGCETPDDVPVHDSATLAVDMGVFSDCASPQKDSGVLPSDDRKHLKAPTQRPNGRADFFALGIDDDVGCTVQGDVTVSLVNLPTTAHFNIEASYVCADGTALAPSSQMVTGGQTATLSPTTACTTASMGDDSGTLIVSVRKLDGPHSSAAYEVQIAP